MFKGILTFLTSTIKSLVRFVISSWEMGTQNDIHKLLDSVDPMSTREEKEGKLVSYLIVATSSMYL